MNEPPPSTRRTRSSAAVTRRAFLSAGAAVAGAVALGGGAAGYLAYRIDSVGSFAAGSLSELRAGRSTPLLDRYPALAHRVPWRPLGGFPTPVEELALPAGFAGVRLYAKRDDLSSELYGGNKVRKLEHLLAEAELGGKDTVVTLGGIGSNHGLATALYGRRLGFSVRLSLFDQPVSPMVRTNLRGVLAAGARLHFAGGTGRALLDARTRFSSSLRAGENPYFIMVGGTSRLGNAGHVNAGLELAAQVRAGALPEPDRLFVPLGTCGTAAGLIVGLRLAGLRTRVAAVRVAEPFAANAWTLRYFAQQVADFLHAVDPEVPRLRIRRDDFDLVTGYLGAGYADPTAAARAAVAWAAPALRLDTTYSGKALAACLDHCRSAPGGQTVLFWNTFNSAPIVEAPTLDGLPPELDRVFTS